jgi:Cytoskeletal-regulatory complex EF hand
MTLGRRLRCSRSRKTVWWTASKSLVAANHAGAARAGKSATTVNMYVNKSSKGINICNFLVSTVARMSSAQQERITEDEQRKYWEIFTALNPVNGYLTGFQAKAVLENSQLDNTQLEAIWDLADVDNGA